MKIESILNLGMWLFIIRFINSIVQKLEGKKLVILFLFGKYVNDLIYCFFKE